MLVRMNLDHPMTEIVREFLTDNSVSNPSSAPAVDIAEYENESVVTMELPGVKKEDINLSLENGWLIVKGERKNHQDPEVKKILHREIATEPFTRSLRLPHRIDADGIAAGLENGMLRITLPKAQEVRPRIINIK
jgi:HSP20 family protein